MRIKNVLITIGIVALAFGAWADDVVDKKHNKRVIVMGDGGKMELMGDGWNAEGLKRGFMGVSMVNLTDDLRAYFGVADGLGVLISEVVPDSPAAKAGLKGGDVLVSVDGKSIDGPAALSNYVREKKGGDQIKVDVRRKGTSQQFFVTLDEREVNRFEVRVPEIQKWVRKNGDGRVEIIELDGDENEALDRMRVFFDSPEFKTRVEKLRDDCSEYQQRLVEIEQKMKELEKKLEKLK